MTDDVRRRPFVSVIIPTFNRSRMLRETVTSFARNSYPEHLLEIIVVDNDSTDDTAEVIAELARDCTLVRPMTERRRGAHFARNTGARAANGDILYFTDDDMLAEEDLLRKIVVPFSSDENVGSATGRVLPRWDSEPPVWVLEHCRNQIFSLNDRGSATMITDEDPGAFSCHQAVLREAFFRAGGFNPDTNAGEFVGDNETGLNIKIRKLGYRFAYVGESVIHHTIPVARMNQRYLNGRFADQGLCDSYTEYRRSVPGRLQLAAAMARNTAMILPMVVLAAARAARRSSAWRLNLARAFYFRNRVIYDARLFRSEEWRRFALRNDWLNDD